VKFLVDAQLPEALAVRLVRLGHDAVHVKRLPKSGDTPDSDITALADAEDRFVVTKDADFRHSHEVSGRPARLLHITLGNLKNQELLDHIERHHSALIAALDKADFVELGSTGLTLHLRPNR
jgi:predicted nuclease of predicted toxin-antitoxin system